MTPKSENQAVGNTSSPETRPASSDAPAPTSTDAVNLTGRSVFAVETTAAGVVVRTAFLTEDNRLVDMPAVFPDALYAFNVLDDLKRQVAQHFAQAAQVGAQVIANQARNVAAGAEPAPTVVDGKTAPDKAVTSDSGKKGTGSVQ